MYHGFMARWLHELTANEQTRLKSLCLAMRRIKPKGWSVVWRTNEVSVRPADRSLGRFSAIYSERHGYGLSFFCRALGVWNKHRRFQDNSSVVERIVCWMVQAVDDPGREESDEHAV